MMELFSVKSKFLRNLSVLVSGTLIAQAIPLVAMPVLTRLYMPAQFGAYALYMSILSVFGAVINGRYELAIMLPDDDDDAFRVFCLAVFIATAASTLAAFPAIYLGTQIGDVIGSPALVQSLTLIPVSLVLLGFQQAFIYWANRDQRFRDIAVSSVSQAGITAICSLSLGMVDPSVFHLIIAYVSGQLASNIWLFSRKLRKIREKAHILSLQHLGRLAVRYQAYPKKSATGGLFHTLSYQCEIVFMPSLFGVSAMGHYYFASRLAAIPKVFISSSIWQVFLGRNRGASREAILSGMRYYQRNVLELSALPYYSSVFIVPELLIFAFGDRWELASIFIIPMLSAAHMNFVVASFSLFILLDRPDAEMRFTGVLVVLKLAMLYLGYVLTHSVVITVIAISIIQFVMFLILGSWNYSQVGESRSYFFRFYFLNMVRVFPLLACLGLVKWKCSFWITLIAVIIVNIIYGLLTLRRIKAWPLPDVLRILDEVEA